MRIKILIFVFTSQKYFIGKEKQESIIPEDIDEVTTIEDLVKSNYIVANSVVYRWKFNENNLKEIFPDNIVPGDYYIHLLHAQDGKIKMINEVMSAYRRHEEGMWWSNDDTNKEKFTMQYGKKFLNFYNVADKYIKLPNNSFYEQRKDMIYNIIVSYTKNEQIEKWKDDIISDTDKKIFEGCMKDIVNRNIWFLDYLKVQPKEQKEKEKLQKERKELQKELEGIKNSRWWKLRQILKKKNTSN